MTIPFLTHEIRYEKTIYFLAGFIDGLLNPKVSFSGSFLS